MAIHRAIYRVRSDIVTRSIVTGSFSRTTSHAHTILLKPTQLRTQINCINLWIKILPVRPDLGC